MFSKALSNLIFSISKMNGENENAKIFRLIVRNVKAKKKHTFYKGGCISINGFHDCESKKVFGECSILDGFSSTQNNNNILKAQKIIQNHPNFIVIV